MPALTCRKEKVIEDELLEAIANDNGIIRLVLKLEVDRSLAENYKIDDVT